MLTGSVGCYPVAKAVWLAADLVVRPQSERALDWHRRVGGAEADLPHL